MALALVAALVLIVGAPLPIDGWQSSAALSEPTSDAAPVDVTIAGERLTLAANMIRSGRARNGGAMERVDLAIHWPTMSGHGRAAPDSGRGRPGRPSSMPR